MTPDLSQKILKYPYLSQNIPISLDLSQFIQFYPNFIRFFPIYSHIYDWFLFIYPGLSRFLSISQDITRLISLIPELSRLFSIYSHYTLSAPAKICESRECNREYTSVTYRNVMTSKVSMNDVLTLKKWNK